MKLLKSILNTRITLLFLLTLYLTASCKSENKYCIKGFISGNAKNVFFIKNGSSKIDTLAVKNNSFIITSDDNVATFGLIYYDNLQKYIPVYLSDSLLTVDLDHRTVKGSAINIKLNVYANELFKLKEEKKILLDSADYFTKFYGNNLPNKLKNRLNKKYSGIKDEIRNVVLSAVNKNQNNILPAHFLYVYEKYFTKDEIIKYCSNDKIYMSMKGMNALASKASLYSNMTLGKTIPDGEFMNINGASFNLSEYAYTNHYVLLNFWASWDKLSSHEIIKLKKLYTEYHDKGLDIIGISYDKNNIAWNKAIRRLNMPWPQLSDLKGKKSILNSKYGVTSIPYNILLGPKGKILYLDIENEKLANKLKNIFENK